MKVVILLVFRDIKENPSVYWNVTLSCPLMASSHATSYLVPISFLVLTMPWIFYPISLFRCESCFRAFLNKNGAWMFLPCSIKNAVAQLFLEVISNIASWLYDLTWVIYSPVWSLLLEELWCDFGLRVEASGDLFFVRHRLLAWLPLQSLEKKCEKFSELAKSTRRWSTRNLKNTFCTLWF